MTKSVHDAKARFRGRRPPSRSATPKRPPTRRATGPWIFGSIPVIGLIGGIGAGKSLAAAALAQHGAFIIDADRVGHSLLQQTPVREQVLRRFGTEVLADPSSPDGIAAIDRRKLGTLVFADSTARRDLEMILHPRMRDTFERAIARTVRRGRYAAVVLDAAVLLEAGWDDLCDLVLFLDAPPACRLERLAATRGWSAELLHAREAAQWPLEEKRRRADLVLDNAGDPTRLEQVISRFWERRLAPPRRDHA